MSEGLRSWRPVTGVEDPALAVAARRVLASDGVWRVRVLGRAAGGSRQRSLVVRALADRDGREPLPVVLKAPVSERVDGFVRERSALSMLNEHGVGGVARLLGASDDPPVLVLEDLGRGRSVADLLLGDDQAAAERGVIDWAVAVGTLQAATAGLGEEFRARRGGLEMAAGDGRAVSRSIDLLPGWIEDTASSLERLLAPVGVRPSRAASEELSTVGSALVAATDGALVAGDTCPDNALYADGGLKLIDFEAAAHRPAVWEAAYLVVPWPTCWCSWKLSDHLRDRALDAWRHAIGGSCAATIDDRFERDLACAVIVWVYVTLLLLLPRAVASACPADAVGPPDRRPRPDVQTLVLHRLRLAATYPTSELPALRGLAAAILEVCIRNWGDRCLPLAPALR